jgi:hypothetical protein
MFSSIYITRATVILATISSIYNCITSTMHFLHLTLLLVLLFVSAQALDNQTSEAAHAGEFSLNYQRK